jgi:hypothetical protein
MDLGYFWHAIHGWVLTGLVVAILFCIFLVPWGSL